jgi:hypothetical protein
MRFLLIWTVICFGAEVASAQDPASGVSVPIQLSVPAGDSTFAVSMSDYTLTGVTQDDTCVLTIALIPGRHKGVHSTNVSTREGCETAKTIASTWSFSPSHDWLQQSTPEVLKFSLHISAIAGHQKILIPSTLIAEDQPLPSFIEPFDPQPTEPSTVPASKTVAENSMADLRYKKPLIQRMNWLKGDHSLKRERSCARKAEKRTKVARKLNYREAITKAQEEATENWDAWNGHMGNRSKCMELPVTERGACEASVNSWLTWATKLSTKLGAGEERVHTGCGILTVNYPKVQIQALRQVEKQAPGSYKSELPKRFLPKPRPLKPRGRVVWTKRMEDAHEREKRRVANWRLRDNVGGGFAKMVVVALGVTAAALSDSGAPSDALYLRRRAPSNPNFRH